jgi:hypothetical protein
LPDGLFSNQKSKFGSILEGLAREHFGMFYDNLVCLPTLKILETFHGHLVYFVVISYYLSRFGILDQEKSGSPAPTKKEIY